MRDLIPFDLFPIMVFTFDSCRKVYEIPSGKWTSRVSTSEGRKVLPLPSKGGGLGPVVRSEIGGSVVGLTAGVSPPRPADPGRGRRGPTTTRPLGTSVFPV